MDSPDLESDRSAYEDLLELMQAFILEMELCGDCEPSQRESPTDDVGSLPKGRDHGVFVTSQGRLPR